MNKAVSAAKQKVTQTVSAVKKTVSSAVTAVKKTVSKAVTAVKQKVTQTVAAIKKKVSNAVTAVKKKLVQGKKLLQSAVKATKAAAKKLLTKAKATGKKLLKAAKGKAKRLVTATKAMVNKAIQAGKAAGRQAKALVKRQVGKVFTDARKLKNNLTKHELVKKLKKDMNRTLLSAKPFIKEVVKGAATGGAHGMIIKQLAKLSPSANAFVKGYEEGVWQAVVSTKDSVVGLVTDPVGTAKGVVTGVWDTVSNPKESFKNLRRDLEGLYYQVKDGSWETRGQLAGNFVMSTISDKGIGKVLKVTPKSQETPKPKETQQPTQGTPKTSNVGSVVKDGNKTKYTNPAGNELTWVDQHPKNINRDIDNKIKSKNVGDATEAKVAEYLKDVKEIKGFGQRIEKKNGQPAGDLDVVTKDEIIEVKASIKAVKEKQFNKLIDENDPDFFNPDKKKPVLYIDKPLTNIHPNDQKMLDRLKSKGVTIVNSLEELKEVLK
ncbi:hypothetical protein P4S91_18705 [Aneurinibacillus aneurinilyticus]|uniref:hypothetical protein n=1 Tax=Aneurinibacillus aneurinilyticus TaxID=1391 RepID=UPI002E1CE693|nr:hypothetical protein [Aneurinibacillus aneurinilyticus]